MLRLTTLLVPIVVLLILLWAVQRRLIYFPFGDLPTAGDVALPRAESVAFPTEDGLTLAAWFVPADPRTGERERTGIRPTILFFGGNAGHRAMRAPLAARLAGRGLATLLVDYRGYGGNPGRPSEEGLLRDARAARRYLDSRSDVHPQGIVYFGESLGTAVAVRLAAERPPFALVLRSPFTSLTDLGRHHYPLLPVSLLLRDRFDSARWLARIACPLLVIAARDDRIVPAPFSERVYAAASASPKQLLILENTDHNDYELLAGARVIDAVVTFLGDSAPIPRAEPGQ